SVDPLGDRTEFVYDPTYHLYVTETHDPLYFTDPRHKTTASWDTVCGEQSQTVDLNDLTTAYTYDALCRPTNVALPDGGFKATSYVGLGNPTSQYIETDTPPADSSGNIWSRTYLDGFGRTWRNLAKGPSGSQTIAVDTAFTPRGTIAT